MRVSLHRIKQFMNAKPKDFIHFYGFPIFLFSEKVYMNRIQTNTYF